VGKFIYEEQARIDVDDRLLAHLQIVIGNKLRRGEPFYFSWKEDQSLGGGRSAVWVHPGATLVFKFGGSKAPVINRTWLEELMYTASSPAGLRIVPEPQEEAPDSAGLTS